MSLFVTIMCFALVAIAAATSGYNYNQPKPVAKQNVYQQASSAGIGVFSAQQSLPVPSFNIQTQPQPQPQLQPQPLPQLIKQNFIAAPAPAPVQQYASQQQYTQQQQLIAPSKIYAQPFPQIAAQAPQYIAPVQQSAAHAPTFAAGPSGLALSQYNQQPQQQTIITKDIYIHSAPEETEEINTDSGVAEDTPIRKNYRIVFIKAPTHNIRFNVESLKRIQAANEERTVIYVLSKKPDITNIHSQLSTIQSEQQSHKPEVYFIKYKTQEEASRAQQEIQAQFDALGGSTRVSDEGIAPVTSVIGGGAINVASGDINLGSSSSNIPSFSGSANFIQTASNSQQQFAQSSFQGSQGSASAPNIAVKTPGNKYLPPKKN